MEYSHTMTYSSGKNVIPPLLFNGTAKVIFFFLYYKRSAFILKRPKIHSISISWYSNSDMITN